MTTTLPPPADTAWASAVANFAYLVSALTPGQLAQVRSGEPGKPDLVLLGTLMEQGVHRHVGNAEGAERVSCWALLAQGVAWCPHTSVSDRDALGAALGRDGYDQAHLRLLLSNDPTSPEFASRFLHACRFLGQRHRAVNWLSIAGLIFSLHHDAIDRHRIRIARDAAANSNS